MDESYADYCLEQEDRAASAITPASDAEWRSWLDQMAPVVDLDLEIEQISQATGYPEYFVRDQLQFLEDFRIKANAAVDRPRRSKPCIDGLPAGWETA